VPESATFGRRAQRTAPSPAFSPAARPAATSDALDPRAEAFRAEVAAGRAAAPAGFEAWRRSQQHRSWIRLALTLLSFAPGVLTFVIDAPLELSIALEVAALVGNVWIRRNRYRQAREIVAWEEPGSSTQA
jgi:hypothetical protein